MSRHRQLPRKAVILAVAALTVALLWGSRPGYGNDIDLLRFNSAKPYVFFILDTSASMTLSPSGQWVHANGDDPRSKLYQAKRVLYDVFRDVDDIHFGFASMNQDKAAVVTKHWLYYNAGALPGGWPINWPRPDVDGPVQTAADGSAVSDVEGDILTFGRHINATGVAGTCAAPLTLGTETEKINRFAKLGALGSSPTVIWLRANGKTYRLTVTRPGNKPDTSLNARLGEDGMHVRFVLEEIGNCLTLPVLQTHTAPLDLRLWTDFVMVDEDTGSLTAAGGGHNGGIDKIAGFWNFQGFSDVASCGSGHPFSGKGWEGNYDGASSGFPASVPIDPTDDPYCNPASPASCYNLKATTQFDPLGRPLDRGDLIPLDWRTENKDVFLKRLAPNHLDGVTPDFRIASYFANQPDPATGVLRLSEDDEVPLFGSGSTPLGKSVVDFRCWYLGGGNKCSDAAYAPGWASIAQKRDSEWGCRRPYLIVISDGADTCGGENPCADTADLNSQGDVRTWVLAYGANCASAGNPAKCMAQNGKGELLCPQTANELKNELLRILGVIREETRAFASAAVPSVQTNVEDKIYLTNFTPLNGKSVWDGHVHSFVKPLPLTIDGRPDTEHENHLWDAGQVMRDTQVNASDPLGPNEDQRRVFYARETASGNLTAARRYLEQPTGTTAADTAIRRDLWRGLGIGFVAGNILSEAAAAIKAQQVINQTLAVKSHTQTVTDPVNGQTTTETVRYLLGDIFHSNPIVIGAPPNTLYYGADLNGYRDYFDKHELRRKMLLVGSNDGMLHAFDAGRYQAAAERFNDGTGKEIFAYIPRPALRTVRELTETSLHKWGVDGTVTVADVHIDPAQRTGVPDADDREWRTVVFGGLREGGSGYYALDITQPDRVVESDGVFVPQPNGSVPSCLGSEDSVPAAGCGPVPFPAPLWEFSDTVRNASGSLVSLDEDANGSPDLGDTWSIPNVGRIRITEDGEVVDKYVMVVGGGFDRDHKATPETGSGTWLYMIDVETGRALYKRQLVGAVPSEPAAVDTNQDGYLDRIYVGTTKGQMYRVDLTAAAAGGSFPELTLQLARDMDGDTHQVQRVPLTAWVPRAIFNANTDNGAPTASSRPIFYRPSVLFVTRLGRYALSFGIGDREDLWNWDGQPGRFYVFVDDTEDLAAATVLDESRFVRLDVTSPSATNEYLIQNAAGQRGWYLVLDANERLITDPFGLSGVTFFSTFKPNIEIVGSRDPLCSRTGISRLFIVSTVNGNPFLTDIDGTTQLRNMVVSQFVTNPFTEQRLTQNTPGGGSGGGGGPEDPPGTGPEETLCDTPTMERLSRELQKLFPPACKFGNQAVDIKTISASTNLLCIASIKVCVFKRDWKEH